MTKSIKNKQLRIKKESHIVIFENYKLEKNPYLLNLPDKINSLKRQYTNIKNYNTCIHVSTVYNSYTYQDLLIFKSNDNTTVDVTRGLYQTSDARIGFRELTINNKEKGHIRIRIKTTTDNEEPIFEPMQEAEVNYYDSGAGYVTTDYNSPHNLPVVFYSTICFNNVKEFIGYYPNYGVIREFVNIAREYFDLVFYCGGKITDPVYPWPEVKPQPEAGEQSDNSSCSNTGQFGGGGTPLKDIKLFLYANNVTKGTIKLSKPQVEVGTFATDWRPNPSDYVERHSPAYKEVKGIAIQHNQSQSKKYLEIETADGYAYGVDLWGGDTKKLLEQQQKEIEELKKLVQTLESKINV